MEKRVNVRDRRCKGDNKPRILDLVKSDCKNSEWEVEVKDGKVRKRILLSDLEQQIREAKEIV